MPLSAPIVGVPTFKVLDWYPSSEQLRPIVRSPSAFRASLRVDPTAQVLLVSVAKDPEIEQFWSRYRKDEIAAAIRDLNVVGMTVPNYSFFDDAPYIHSVWNRWRMIRVAEHLSAEGIAVIPHLNALNSNDWDFWAGYLREHSNVTCIAKEFQTGNAKGKHAREAIYELRRLEQQLGRSLHPIVFGARFVIGELKASLRHFTVADANPFVKTVKRRELTVSVEGRRHWHFNRLDEHELLDNLLARNLEEYTRWVESEKPKPFSFSQQLTLRLK